MKSRWGMVLAAVLAIGIWAAPASGQRPGGPEMYGAYGGHGDMMLHVLLRGVALTEAQKGQVRQIVANHRPQFEGLVSQLRSAREQLADKLYASGPVKAEDLAPLTQQIAQLRGQISQEGLQVALEIRAVLTPEQLAKAGQVRQRVKELQAEMRSLLGGNQ